MQNGHEDVVERLTDPDGQGSDGTLFEFYALFNNDETGYKLFDIVFAPYYSMFFGTPVQEVQGLNNLISIGDGEEVVQNVWDINNDGMVSTADLLIFLTAFGGTYGVGDLLEFLSEGFASSIDTLGDQVEFTEIDSWTADSFLALYDGSPREIHSVYTNQLNAPELTGRYMKIDLVSDDEQDGAQLYEVIVDHDNRVKSLSRRTKVKKQ